MTRPKATRTFDDYAREFGLNLLRARSAIGLSQEKVAHVVGVSAYTYQKYEKGESKPGTPINVTLKNLLALSQALRVPVAELLPSWTPDLTEGS